MLEGREWRRVGGASPAAIEHLKAIAPVALPASYLSLLAFSNGGEGPLAVQPYWLCLHPAEEVVHIEQSGILSEYFPKLFVIGDNGAGEAVALDLRQTEPYPLVAFDMTNIDLSESIMTIAASFDAAMELIGHDE